MDAAFTLIGDLLDARGEGLPPEPKVSADTLVLAPHAVEADGDNAIPEMFATLVAIVSRARPAFGGTVEVGRAYVLVDDVTTMGGTLADLADCLRASGATVAGAVVLASASRTACLTPDPLDIRRTLDAIYGAAEVFSRTVAELSARPSASGMASPRCCASACR